VWKAQVNLGRYLTQMHQTPVFPERGSYVKQNNKWDKL